MTKKILRCSFCNKTQDQVRKLIAGPRVRMFIFVMNVLTFVLRLLKKNLNSMQRMTERSIYVSQKRSKNF